MTKLLRPLKAIREHCLACGGRPKEVKGCQSTECALFPYRMGTNPARKGIGVGIRHNNGQFKAKIASPAGNLEKISTHDSIDEAKVVAIEPCEILEKIDIVRKGQVSIQNKEGAIVIKISPE